MVRLKEQGENGTNIAKIPPAFKSTINALYNKFLQTGDAWICLTQGDRQRSHIGRKK